MGAPDVFYFKTEYINEIPLYDLVQQSILPAKNDSKLGFKKFSLRNFSIKNLNPLVQLQDQPGIVLSYGIDVLSMFFSQERPLNIIITLYDSKKNLTDSEIQTIL